MSEDAIRRDGVALQDIDAERLDGLHLDIRKVWIVEVVAGIMDLDADGARIEIRLSGPKALPGMPCPHVFRDELRHDAVRVDQIVARHLGLLAGEPVERSLGRIHAGIMQDEHVRPPTLAARLYIRRRLKPHRQGSVGGGGHAV
jgi:hypothetical protein